MNTNVLDRRLGLERLHALDAGFLALESPSTPMHMGSITYFDGPPLRDAQGRIRLDDLRRLVAARLAPAPRFRQRPQAAPLGLGRPVWVDDPYFDVAHHVNAIVLPAPGTEDQLRDLFAHLMMRLLDRSRPLWELWVVDGLADGTVAAIEKIHHVMMDGISGIDVAMLMTDASAEGPRVSQPPAERQRRGAVGAPPPTGERAVVPGDVELLAAGLLDELALPVWMAGAPLRAAAGLGGALARPSNARALGGRLAALGRATLSLVSTDTVAPPSPLNRPVGRRRRYVHVEVPLGTMRRVGEAFGCTLNDVALAAVAGGVRRLDLGRGLPPAGFQVAVPVSTRRAAEHLALGNRVAFFLVPLPVEIEDPADRLQAVHRLTRRRKEQGQADLVAAVVEGADRWPAAVVDLVARMVNHQPFANAVVTNVPGPPATRFLLGARMRRLAPVVPLAGNLDISVCIVSYDEEVSFGCFADAERCPDVGELAAGIAATVASLGREAAARPGARPAPRARAARHPSSKGSPCAPGQVVEGGRTVRTLKEGMS